MTLHFPGEPSHLPVPVDPAGGWSDTGPADGFVAIIVAFRLIHRPVVIEAASAMLNSRLGWAFQPWDVLPSYRNGSDVRLYGNLLVPVPGALLDQARPTSTEAPANVRRRRD